MKTKAVLFGIIATAFLLNMNGSVFAQSAGNTNTKMQEKKEKVQAMKIAFISDKITLSAKEAENFWPLYNEYEAKKTDLQKENRQNNKSLKQNGTENLTEDQADQIVNAQLAQEQSLLDLKKEYYPKFTRVIGSVKVVQLYLAEKEFNKMLVEKLKENRQKPAMTH